jgi:S-formylglutathione hydrolase FrmB
MILRGDFSSEVLRVSVNIQVLIPDHAAGPYCVVYLLHGLHGNQGTWLDNTMLPVYAKKYNAAFVMPEGMRSFYTNQKYGREYYAFFSEELPRVCKKVFTISAKREDTAVMGCSMGGYGALRLALSKPEQFGFCGAISPACLYFKELLAGLRKDPAPWLTGPEEAAIYQDLKIIYGDDLAYRPDYDIVELIKNFPASSPKPVIYAACGTEDDLRSDNLRFRDEMKNIDFDYTYEEWQGGHDWYFFNEALKKALQGWYTTS